MGQMSPSSTASLQLLSKRLWGLSSPLASQTKGQTQARLPSAHWTVMSEEDALEPSLRMRSKTNTWLLIKMITALTLLILGDLKGKPPPPKEFPLTWATNWTTNFQHHRRLIISCLEPNSLCRLPHIYAGHSNCRDSTRPYYPRTHRHRPVL